MNLKPGEYKLVVDEFGNRTTHDSNGNWNHYKTSKGYELWYEYDSNGNRIHMKDSYGYEKWWEFDSNRKVIHYKDSTGYEYWYEYDSNGNEIHYKTSNGYETWFNSEGDFITKEEFDRQQSSYHGKVVTIDGKTYQLKELK